MFYKDIPIYEIKVIVSMNSSSSLIKIAIDENIYDRNIKKINYENIIIYNKLTKRYIFMENMSFFVEEHRDMYDGYLSNCDSDSDARSVFITLKHPDNRTNSNNSFNITKKTKRYNIAKHFNRIENGNENQ